MPWKVISSKRNQLQAVLDKWSDEAGPIKVMAMEQSLVGDDVTLTIFYQGTSGAMGSGYSSEPPKPRADANKKDEDFGSAPECPECGAEMKLRRRNVDKVPFWGCSGFPDCRGIVNIDDEKPKPRNGSKKKAKKGEVDERQEGFGFGEGTNGGVFDEEDDVPF